MKKRFTYGDQFEAERTPLPQLLEFCQIYAPERAALQDAIQSAYFLGDTDNARKMAMNCLLSLNAYGLIELNSTGKNYKLTPLYTVLAEVATDTQLLFRQFARHILSRLEGLLLLRLIENIRARGEQVSLEYLGEELNDLGIKIPPNSTYISTMRGWLAQAGVFHASSYEIHWDVVFDLINVDTESINRLYQLSLEQKFFLLSMVNLAITEFTPSNKIANHTRSVCGIRLTSKNLVKDVLLPLEQIGLLETVKTTLGRGAKPHDVRLTAKAQNELLLPLLENLVTLTELTLAELNRTFEAVVADLTHPEKHIRGVALELLAVWLVRLLGLRFGKWRLKSHEATGGGEVDVMAASDKIVYNRWQIQCKNIKGNVDVDTIAKEVGLTFLTKADVIMVVTMGNFTSQAINYANQVTDTSRYYIILLDGSDIDKIIADRSKIIDILNLKARRVFAKKELGIADFAEDLEDET
jgi:Restriction endonuclease